MNRTMVVVVALAGAAGLASGWLAPVPRPGPAPAAAAAPPPALTRRALKPAAEAAPAGAAPARAEFALGEADVANDRETPAVAAAGNGRVVVAWAAQTGELERTVYLARSADGGKSFSPPSAFRKVPVYRFTSPGRGKSGSGAMVFSTHVLPRLAWAADGLYLGWVEAVGGGPDVAFFVARSGDGGGTFGAPARVHGGDASRPGFTALAAAADGALLAGWLDGRNKAGQQPFLAAKPAGSEGFGGDRLVFAGPDGKGICPCCDVSAVRLPDGSDLVAFRNSDSGRRDVWLARAPRGGGFGPPAPAADDHWAFDGCPHDGPSLVLASGTVHAAWMSAHSGRNRVYAASSPPADLAFHPREVNPSAPGAQGHPKLAASPDGGSVLAVWDESLDDAAPAPVGQGHGHGPALTGGGRAVMFARVGAGASGVGPAEAVAPRPGAFQLNPAAAVGADGALLVAFAEVDAAGKRVVFVRRDPR